MLKALRKRIQITPATVIASLALVFAMTGGAYAAGRYVITSTKQISPKVLKSLKGANGKNGTNGAAGAQGPAGPTGPGGAAGAAGAKGETGTAGTDGTNGKEGKQGPPGPTEFTVLPPEQSEHGVWSFQDSPTPGESESRKSVPISFPIPLPKVIEASSQVHIVASGEGPQGCEKGTLEEPKAAPGNLCIYTGELSEAEFTGEFITNPENPSEPFTGQVGKSGAILHFIGTGEGASFAKGVWVVTAPAES
jgi:hypothetical protein